MNNNINFKYKGENGVAGVVVLFFLLLIFISIAVPAISALIADPTDPTLIVMAVLLCLMFAPILIFFFASYIKGKKKYQAVINKYDEKNLLIHLENNTLKKYEYDLYGYHSETYFTDKLIVSPGSHIVSYGEIAWMYKGIVQNKNSSYAYISLRLYNGTEARICSHIKDEEIMEYFNFIYMHNSKILFHNEPANRTNYNNRVYAYKNGIIKIDPVDISVPLNRDEYDFSGVFPKKKGRFDSEEELEEYIEQNYEDSKMEEAIELYSEETSTDTYSAAREVERIFDEREEKGMKLKTPYEFTEQYKKYKNAQGLVMMGLFLLGFCALGLFGMFGSGDVEGNVWAGIVCLTLFATVGMVMEITGFKGLNKYKKDKDEF